MLRSEAANLNSKKKLRWNPHRLKSLKKIINKLLNKLLLNNKKYKPSNKKLSPLKKSKSQLKRAKSQKPLRPKRVRRKSRLTLRPKSRRQPSQKLKPWSELSRRRKQRLRLNNVCKLFSSAEWP